MTDGNLREAVARAIAHGLGDNFDHAFVSKAEWNQARGEKGGRMRDINEPMQGDYLEAAEAAIAAIKAAGYAVVPGHPAPRAQPTPRTMTAAEVEERNRAFNKRAVDMNRDDENGDARSPGIPPASMTVDCVPVPPGKTVADVMNAKRDENGDDVRG